MKEKKISGGTKIWSSGEHRSGKTGELIWSGKTHNKWWLYFFGNWDTWRSEYCEKNRDTKLPLSFREGKFNTKSIIVTLYLKCKEKK